MMKKAILVLITLYLINLVCASSLGISPSSIEFYQKANEKACSKVTLFCSANSTLIGESKWSSKSNFEKDIRYYTLEADSLGITLKYPQDVEVNNKKEIEVCLVSEKEGKYEGALIYSIENKPAAVGTWIHADIQGKKPSNKITGAFLSNANMTISKTKAVIFTLTIFLLLILLILLAILKRTKAKASKKQAENPILQPKKKRNQNP